MPIKVLLRDSSSVEKTVSAIRNNYPVVIKTDGPAGGKVIIVAWDETQLREAFDRLALYLEVTALLEVIE